MINIVIKRLAIMIMIILGIAVIGASHAYAVDPPHNDTVAPDTWWCTNCHTLSGVSSALKTPKGNSGRCLTCHTTTGMASNKPFTEADEAVPGITGIYHRWDSGPGGYVKGSGSNTSTGNILSGIPYTWNSGKSLSENLQSIFFSGTLPRTYTLTIATDGDVGAATFSWQYQDEGGNIQTGVNNVMTGTNVELVDSGGVKIKVTFVAGSSPSTLCSKSFCKDDIWTIKVRPQINYPTTYSPTDPYANLTKKMFTDTGAPNDIADVDPTAYIYPASTYGKASCSTCHNQHFQTNMSNDPFSPSYDTTVPFSNGAGRHYQRISNQQNELCLDCHSARNKGNNFSDGDPDNDVRTYSSVNKKSHPVGVVFPSVKPENAALMHSVPREPSYASGAATSVGTTTQLTDNTKTTWTTDELKNLRIRFIGGKNDGEYRDITANTITGTISWTTSLSTAVAVNDSYVIEVVQSDKTTSGKATSSGTNTTLNDTGKLWADSSLSGLSIRFTSGQNKGLYARISGNTLTQVTFAAVTYPVAKNDAYVIDADQYGNPTNNFRLFDDSDTANPANWKPSFIKGKVYCLTCHDIHWADSDQTTYDR